MRVRICGLFDLPLFGGRLFMDVADTDYDVIIFKLPGGRLRAWDAHCPHAGALLRPMNEMGGELVCYLHTWVFDIDTGDCKTVPQCPLTGYAVEVVGMDVFLELPDP
jgi:nitrite reductase/ring-hydroxylating ferredoxin subunit